MVILILYAALLEEDLKMTTDELRKYFSETFDINEFPKVFEVDPKYWYFLFSDCICPSCYCWANSILRIE